MTSIIHDQTKTESRDRALSLCGGMGCSRPTPARGQGGAHVRVVGVASILPMFDAPRETDWAFGLSPFAAFARRPLGSRDRRLGRPSRLSRPQFTPRSLDPDDIHELRICELTGTWLALRLIGWSVRLHGLALIVAPWAMRAPTPTPTTTSGNTTGRVE